MENVINIYRVFRKKVVAYHFSKETRKNGIKWKKPNVNMLFFLSKISICPLFLAVPPCSVQILKDSKFEVPSSLYDSQ